MEFAKCDQCGKIYRREANEAMCPTCRNEPAPPPSDKDYLRAVRNLIKDAMVNGELLTTQQIIDRTGVPEAKIWHFISTGEIDTASFRDPEVQRFVQKQRLERMRKLSTDDEHKEGEEEQPSEPHRGFHTRENDERRR